MTTQTTIESCRILVHQHTPPGRSAFRCALVGIAVIGLGLMPAVAHAARTFAGTVNLNTATLDELQQLPGVGPAKAQKIVDHRGRKPFRTVAELSRVKGFGAKTVSRLRPFITITGPTNLGAPNATGAAACPCACDPLSKTAPASVASASSAVAH